MDINSILERFKRGVRDVVGLDLGTTSSKAVHLHRNGESITVMGAQLLPPLEDIPRREEGVDTMTPPLPLNKNTYSRCISLAITGHSAVIKLLTFPGSANINLIQRLPQDMGIKEPDRYRLSYRVVTEGRGRQESRVLAVGLPEDEAAVVTAHFATGFPAPHSLEIASLAAISAFQQACGQALEREAVGILEFGATTTTFSILNKNIPVLIRRFDFGNRTLTARIRESLGVSDEIARGILTDTAFDISEVTAELLSPIISQVKVSRDFIERRENCRLSAIYASGALMVSADVNKLLIGTLDTEVRQWNPFDGLTLAPDALSDIAPESFWCFAGATGAALSTLEES